MSADQAQGRSRLHRFSPAAAAAGRYAVAVVAVAAAVHVVKPLQMLLSAGLMPMERQAVAALSAALVPALAVAYWALLLRWERRHATRGYAGPAMFLLALALAFAVLTLGGSAFSYFYPVFLFLVGLSTGQLMLSSVALLAAFAAAQERFLLVPWLPPTLVFWVLAVACVGAWLRLRSPPPPPSAPAD